jgi:YihY family inner membrane protein
MPDMNLNPFIAKLDAFQQRHKWLAVGYAVIKKYGDDNGGYQAALLTYYGFLSLFPLLLVIVTILQIWFSNNAPVRDDVLASIGHFFPLLTSQLQANIHSMHKTGLGLLIGLVITIYGARGVADALRHALDNMWQVPRNKRAGFPKNILHSMSIIAAGAVSFVAVVAVSAFSSSLGHALWTKILLNVLGFLLLTAVFGFIFRIATFGRVPLRWMYSGASVAGFVTQLLLTFGGLIIKHQLQHLNSVYGTFAVVLGLLFWIYLLAQVIVYAAEVDTVRHLKLWPRSMTSTMETTADRIAYRRYAKIEERVSNERISVDFRKAK